MDGWYNPDQIEGASEKEIQLAIKGLIPISSQFWGNIDELEWVPNMKESYMLNLSTDMVEYQPEFLNRFEYLMDDSRVQLLDKVVKWYPNFHDILSEGTLTLTHWDYRVENLFFTPEVDDLTVIDWQLMMANKPGWDLAYLLCTNIQIDLRRKIFEDSCSEYLDGLKRNGINLSSEELHKNMMLSLLAMLTFPVVGGANYDLENMRSKKLFEVLTERLFSSIRLIPIIGWMTFPFLISWSAISFALFIGIAKLKPAPGPDLIKVLIPITSPLLFKSGPPEFPGLIAASV